MNSVVKSIVMGCVLSFSGLSMAVCPPATPTTSETFCASFKAATECHCMLSGLPKGRCTNMSLVYKMMIDMLGPLPRSCAYQHHTSAQECIDDWNCYRYGGLTSEGQLCNGTGHACS